MISELFTMNSSNFGNAAMDAASRPIPLDDQVEMKLAAHGPSPEEDAYIEVRSPSGFACDIHIDPVRMEACRLVEGYEGNRTACQQLVDELAAQIRAAVLEAQAHAAGPDREP